MVLLGTLAALLTLTAVFAYVNHLYIKLPTTIGVMLIALVASLVAIGLDVVGFGGIEDRALELLSHIDFSTAVLHGMLSFLLFAGALHVNLGDLADRAGVIGSLATAGVLMSTVLVGLGVYSVAGLLGIELSLLYCFVFGALISPTDPIAVLGLLKTAGVPKTLETTVTGESLFNDGVGVVLFLVLYEVLVGHEEVSAGSVAMLFATEAGGGAIFGLGMGFVAFHMLRRVDNYQVEVLVTLALVMGGYSLATTLHLSGPIAIVVAGLLIGNHGRMLAMSDRTRANLDTFWELIDEILNAVLFVLIGLEVLILRFSGPVFGLGIVAIVVVLLARLTSVAAVLGAWGRRSGLPEGAVSVLTWGGLRGGISVALALSLPPGPERSVLLPVTYMIVVFSIVVQGLTIPRVVRWAVGEHEVRR